MTELFECNVITGVAGVGHVDVGVGGVGSGIAGGAAARGGSSGGGGHGGGCCRVREGGRSLLR